MFSKSKINDPSAKPDAAAAEKPAAPINQPAAEFKPAAPKAKPPASVLSSDLHVTGNLKTTGDIQVEGRVDGDIRAHLLTIGEGATVKGEIIADDVVVNGHVKGDIYASKQAKLASKAVVEGNIHYNLIEIEKGAEVVGSFVHEQPQTNVTAFPKEGRSEEGPDSSKKADKQSV